MQTPTLDGLRIEDLSQDDAGLWNALVSLDDAMILAERQPNGVWLTEMDDRGFRQEVSLAVRYKLAQSLPIKAR